MGEAERRSLAPKRQLRWDGGQVGGCWGVLSSAPRAGGGQDVDPQK